MNDTPNLALPYILPSQAQKHVTHNEAIRALDCLVQLAVESRSLSEPPASPAEGARYIVATAAAASWSGQSDKIAAFQDGAWTFYEPKEGWVAWVSGDHELAIYSAGAWASFGGGSGSGDSGDITEIDDLVHLGINATADTTNRLSLKSPASLFDNEGAGHQQKINKHAAGDTASVVYQTNYSGRAEMGLTGDDDFHFKVSPDGATWHDALTIDRNSGRVSFPVQGGPREVLTANRTYYVRSDGSDANTGLANTAAGAFATIQKALDVVAALDLSIFDVTIQVGAGTYSSPIFLSGGWVGAGDVTLQGDTTTPSNVNLSFANYGDFQIKNYARLAIAGFKVSNAAASSLGQGLLVSNGASVTLGVMEWSTCTRAHIEANSGATINYSGNFTISGDAPLHWLMTQSSMTLSSFACMLSGTRAFSNGFIQAQSGAVATVYNFTFSGTATGKRYSAALNAIVNTFGGGASYFPGNAAGTTATGAQYA